MHHTNTARTHAYALAIPLSRSLGLHASAHPIEQSRPEMLVSPFDCIIQSLNMCAQLLERGCMVLSF